MQKRTGITWEGGGGRGLGRIPARIPGSVTQCRVAGTAPSLQDRLPQFHSEREGVAQRPEQELAAHLRHELTAPGAALQQRAAGGDLRVRVPLLEHAVALVHQLATAQPHGLHPQLQRDLPDGDRLAVGTADGACLTRPAAGTRVCAGLGLRAADVEGNGQEVGHVHADGAPPLQAGVGQAHEEAVDQCSIGRALGHHDEEGGGIAFVGFVAQDAVVEVQPCVAAPRLDGLASLQTDSSALTWHAA